MTATATSGGSGSSYGWARTTTTRAGGPARSLCGSSVELGQLRLDCAFFAWTLDGREGVGRYDVLRRA